MLARRSPRPRRSTHNQTRGPGARRGRGVHERETLSACPSFFFSPLREDFTWVSDTRKMVVLRLYIPRESRVSQLTYVSAVEPPGGSACSNILTCPDVHHHPLGSCIYALLARHARQVGPKSRATDASVCTWPTPGAPAARARRVTACRVAVVEGTLWAAKYWRERARACPSTTTTTAAVVGVGFVHGVERGEAAGGRGAGRLDAC